MNFHTVVFFLGFVVAFCTAQLVYLSHAEALRQFKDAGIVLNRQCSDKLNPKCTSLEQILQSTVTGTIRLKQNSGCDVVVTGGTEVGHGWHHSNGYKVDLRKTECLSRYIKQIASPFGKTPIGQYPIYKDSFSNVYIDEGNHWDVKFVY